MISIHSSQFIIHNLCCCPFVPCFQLISPVSGRPRQTHSLHYGGALRSRSASELLLKLRFNREGSVERQRQSYYYRGLRRPLQQQSCRSLPFSLTKVSYRKCLTTVCQGQFDTVTNGISGLNTKSKIRDPE